MTSLALLPGPPFRYDRDTSQSDAGFLAWLHHPGRSLQEGEVMKVYGFRIFVSDLSDARRFYAEVLRLPISFETEEAIGFDAGIQLIVEKDDGEHAGLQGRFTGISFSVENLRAEYEALTARGVHFISPPEKQPWGGSLAHFSDPSQNILTLVSV